MTLADMTTDAPNFAPLSDFELLWELCRLESQARAMDPRLFDAGLGALKEKRIRAYYDEMRRRGLWHGPDADWRKGGEQMVYT